MCCRYYIDDESEQFRTIIEEMSRSPLLGKWKPAAAIKTSGEIRPTDIAPVIAPNKAGSRTVFPMQWGYTGRSLLLNARSETAAEKPAFREDWRRHRCIVPATYYFEWEHRAARRSVTKTVSKYAIHPKDAAMTWLCGLYRIEGGVPRFVVLTREPADTIRFIHNRMPLILPEEFLDEWIRPDAEPEKLFRCAVTDMEFEKCN